MPDAGVLATVMLLAGLFLLGLELFIPSFGMILVMAVLALIVSFWSACKAWWGVNPGFFWTYIILLTAGIPGSLMGAVTVLQRTSLGNRMILKPVAPAAKLEPGPLDHLIGKSGIAQTMMTPGGIVLIEGERVHAESIGMLVEPNSPVIAVSARGNRLVVRPKTEADQNRSDSAVHDLRDTSKNSPLASAADPSIGSLSDSAPLDFDIPEN